MKKSSTLMLMLFFLNFISSSFSFCQKLEWDYPIKPKSKAWGKLTTPEERLNACQMDEQSLKKVSTEGLVYVCMEHPFFGSYVISDSPINGLMNIMNNFNGYSELIGRENALKIIMEVVASENYNQLADLKDSSAIGGKTLMWSGLEMMMCQDKLIDKLSKDEKNMFLKQLALKYDEKSKYKEYFGGINHKVTAFLSRKLLKSLGEKTDSENKEKQKKFDSFDSKMIIDDGTVVKEMIAQFKNYTKNLK